jgi:hypothetical protein
MWTYLCQLGHRVRRDLLGLQGLKDLRDRLEWPVLLDPKVQQALLETQVLQGRPEPLAHMEQLAHKAPPAQRDQLGHKDHPDTVIVVMKINN